MSEYKEELVKNYNDYSKAAYDSKADHYDTTFDGKFTKPFKELLLSNIILKENDKVLDIACGNGTLLKMLSEKKPIEGYGIDLSDKMVENAVRNCPDMTFKVAGCDNIPFDSDGFDVMTVSAAYHHFPDVKTFAKEAARVIKRGGYLYIAEVYLPSILRVICNPFVPLSKEGDVKFYSPTEIVRNFEAFGFEKQCVLREKHIQIVCMQKSE